MSAATAVYKLTEDECLICEDCGKDLHHREKVVLTAHPDGCTVEIRCEVCQEIEDAAS